MVCFFRISQQNSAYTFHSPMRAICPPLVTILCVITLQYDAKLYDYAKLKWHLLELPLNVRFKFLKILQYKFIEHKVCIWT